MAGDLPEEALEQAAAALRGALGTIGAFENPRREAAERSVAYNLAKIALDASGLVARVRADVAEEIARAIGRRERERSDEREDVAISLLLIAAADRGAEVAREHAVAPAESVVGAPTPTAATGGQDCPNCRRYGAPARVEHCGPGCHEAHTYMPPCELAVRALPEDEGARQEGLINVEE